MKTPLTNIRTRTIALLLTLPLLSGCYVNLKSKIDREVKVQISNQVPVVVTNTGNSNFTTYMNQDQYVEAFLRGLNGELGGTENVVLVETGGEYLVTFDQVKVEETTEIEKIDDKESDDHGKEFELTTLKLSASGKVQRISDGTTRDWSAYKDKSETTTSLRSAGQVLTGDNKDKTEYREKAFDSGTAEGLTQNVGRRSGVVVVRDIGQLMKK